MKPCKAGAIGDVGRIGNVFGFYPIATPTTAYHSDDDDDVLQRWYDS